MTKFFGRENNLREKRELEIPGLAEINEKLRQLNELADRFYSKPIGQRNMVDIEPINQEIKELLKKRDELIKIFEDPEHSRELLEKEQAFVVGHQQDLKTIQDEEDKATSLLNQ